MSVLILTHPSSHLHVPPAGHPERVARIEAVEALLDSVPYDALPREEAPAASDEELARAHDRQYLESLERAVPEEGWTALDPDTHLGPQSLVAARHAAGANIRAVDAVLSGAHRAAFCAVRPCGHHAERDRAMGFCFYDNVAVGALHALEHHGLERVAIVDFDVHHGNGTQDIFERDARVLFASTHQFPLFPGTGAEHETGVGNIVNCPLRPMTGGKDMRTAFETRVLPQLDAFRPQLVMISAGFDAHVSDPLANLYWTDSDFRWATDRLCEAAVAHADGRVVSTLEGGYDLDGLKESVQAHLDGLVAHTEAA
ncbi:MAG: histone deacetylase family protein [Paracoccaceae bacterium]